MSLTSNIHIIQITYLHFSNESGVVQLQSGHTTGWTTGDREIMIRFSEKQSRSSNRECPYLLWRKQILLFNGYSTLFPWCKRGHNLKLTNHFHLVPRLRKSGAVLYTKVCLHDKHRNKSTFNLKIFERFFFPRVIAKVKQP